VAAKTVEIKTAKTIAITMAGTNNRKSCVPAPTQKALDVFVAPSNTDVKGSYTGKPKNKGEMPVQDADDL
jgi:hypothetical protein